MLATEYLYDCKPSAFSNLPYKEALEYKLKRANEHIYVLVQPHYSKRDEERISKVFEAIKHNRYLLEELE